MTDVSERTFVVGIDIGSSKLVAAVGEYIDDTLHIRASATEKIRCVREGTISEIEPLIKTINKAIKAIEKESKCEIYSLSSTIAGKHIHGETSHGSASIRGGKSHAVSERDLYAVLDTAGAVPLPKEQRVIHVLPSTYKIDNQDGIKNPLGMSGVRLEANVYVVDAAENAIQNITNCFQSCGRNLDSVVFQGLASSFSVLTDDEKELGVCLIDMGSGTTDITVYSKGAVIYTESLPLAGDRVTLDIALAKRLQSNVAEMIKVEYGSCMSEHISTDEMIELPVISNQSDGRNMRRQELAQIIEARYDEIFEMIKKKLEAKKIDFLYGSKVVKVVLTGGSANVHGVEALAERVFQVPARVGTARNIDGNIEELEGPEYSAIFGLLAFHHHHESWQKKIQNTVSKQGIFSKMYSFIKKTF